jgi:MFS family permease
MYVRLCGLQVQLSPWTAFVLFTWLNLLIFVDRGIIPGSTVEFNQFIVATTGTHQSDVLLGLLQSSFVVGLVGGAVLFGHFAHRYDPFFLTGVGISVWAVAGICAGLSYYVRSYGLLLVARVVSGLGEASLLCNIPPWIQTHAPKGQQGAWLGLFYTAIPVGTAFGYAYSAALATSVGWPVAFFVEVATVAPVVAVVFTMSNDSLPSSTPSTTTSDTTSLLAAAASKNPPAAATAATAAAPATASPRHHATLTEELTAILSSPVYVCYCLASAAQAAVLIGLSTFGSALLLGLGYFDDEATASSVFGVLISIAGILATPLGGWLVDALQRTARHPSTAASGSRSGVTVPRTSLRSPRRRDADSSAVDTRDRDDVIIVPPVVGDFEAIETDTDTDTDGAAVAAHPTVEDMQLLAQVSMAMYWATWLSAVLFSVVVFCETRASFLAVLTLAAACCFVTNAGVALGQIASVPRRFQSFALAIAALVLHVLGDVPSPIVAGLVKDAFAPACVAPADGGGDGAASATSVACRAEGSGQRWFVLVVSLWLFWAVFWFGAAWIICDIFVDSGGEEADSFTWSSLGRRWWQPLASSVPSPLPQQRPQRSRRSRRRPSSSSSSAAAAVAAEASLQLLPR